MFPDTIQLLIAIVVLAVVAGILIGFVHLSRQTTFPRSRQYSVAILARLVFVYVFSWIVLCMILGLHVQWFVALVLLVFVLSPLATVRGPGPVVNFAVEFAIVIVVLLPVYVVKQFILGFPERDFVVLSPPKPSRENPAFESNLPDLDQQMVTVVATLKPVGRVELNGNRFDATSFDGSMIDIGQMVQVCERRGQMYVVRVIKS